MTDDKVSPRAIANSRKIVFRDPQVQLPVPVHGRFLQGWCQTTPQSASDMPDVNNTRRKDRRGTGCGRQLAPGIGYPSCSVCG
jgi:hypothetical protein